ncbi:MAG: hypothetical protein QXO69_01240 [archaeon]
MAFGSFDKAIANSKLTYAEKYRKATMDDLNMFKNVLGANIHISENGQLATINLNGYVVNVSIVY